MAKTRLLVLFAALSTILAACATQNDISAPVQDAEPRFDGGMGYGSGNRSGGDTTGIVRTQDSEQTTAQEGQTLLPGGMGYGSGN